MQSHGDTLSTGKWLESSGHAETVNSRCFKYLFCQMTLSFLNDKIKVLLLFPVIDVDPISEYCPTGGWGGKDYKREDISCSSTWGNSKPACFPGNGCHRGTKRDFSLLIM